MPDIPYSILWYSTSTKTRRYKVQNDKARWGLMNLKRSWSRHYADSAGVVSYLMIMVLLLAESDPFTLELDWSSTSIGASLSINAALEVDIPEEIVNELPVEREEFDVAAGPSRASPPVSDFFPLTISSSTRSICKCLEDGTVLTKQPERVAIYYCVRS